MLPVGLALFQTSIAIGFMCAHGAPLFAIPLLMPDAPERVRGDARAPGGDGRAVHGVLMAAVAFDMDAAAVLHSPATLLFPLSLLLEAAYVGWIVGRSAVSHRGAGIVDELTGLLNRTALRARLLELDAQSERASHRVGMLLIDVDRFKEINDGAGHAAGDVVLREPGHASAPHCARMSRRTGSAARRSSCCCPMPVWTRRATSLSACAGRSLRIAVAAPGDGLGGRGRDGPGRAV